MPLVRALTVRRALCAHSRRCWGWQQQRHISEEQLNADKDRLEDLFHKNLAQADRTRRTPVLTTRRCGLSSLETRVQLRHARSSYELLSDCLTERQAFKGLMKWVLVRRREALALYREILRYSNLLVWKDAQGRVWRDVIRASARKVITTLDSTYSLVRSFTAYQPSQRRPTAATFVHSH